MPNLTQLRLAAREIFDETLKAIYAGAAVRRAVRLTDSQLSVCDATLDIGNRKIYSVAVGKAAFTMAHGLEQVLGDSFTEGVISGPALPGPKETPERKLGNSLWLSGTRSRPAQPAPMSATFEFCWQVDSALIWG